jgi:hypothetical protein
MPGGDGGLGPEDPLACAVATGQLLDLRSDEPGQDDQAAAASWDETRTITAEMLAGLLTHTGTTWQVGATASCAQITRSRAAWTA